MTNRHHRLWTKIFPKLTERLRHKCLPSMGTCSTAISYYAPREAAPSEEPHFVQVHERPGVQDIRRPWQGLYEVPTKHIGRYKSVPRYVRNTVI